MSVLTRLIGAPVDRIEGRHKVAGEATYAFEYHQEHVAYAVIVQSAIAKGIVRAVNPTAALALPGVLAVLSHENAPALASAEGELAVLQSTEISYRGQIVAAVIADSLETAQQAGQLVQVGYGVAEHDVELRADHPGLYKPDKVNPNFPTDTEAGDVEQALATAVITVDETYTTPAQHNNPMEPHATIAAWENGGLTLYDSNQGAWRVAETVAEVFGLEAKQIRVISPARRRRLWLEGRAAPARRPRGDVCAARSACGETRGDAAADVHAHGVPHPDDPAAPARGRPGWQADGDRTRCHRADIDGAGVRRTDGGRHANDVRLTEPTNDAPSRRAEPAHSVLDARSG